MLFPLPLGAGCCRSYLGQLQPSSSGERPADLAEWWRQQTSMLNISHHMPQIHAEATHQKGWPAVCFSEPVCVHIIYKPVQLDFINNPFWNGKSLLSTDMIAHCQLDNMGMVCSVPLWRNVIYDWLLLPPGIRLFISVSDCTTRDTWKKKYSYRFTRKRYFFSIIRNYFKRLKRSITGS